MDKLKIALGILLTYGAGREFASSSKQLGSFYNLPVLAGLSLLLLLSAWLIGRGYSKERVPLKSLNYLKYLGVTLALFLLFALFSWLTIK